MPSPYECVRTRYELFPPISSTNVEEQRNELFNLFSSRGLIDPGSRVYNTDNPAKDIANIRFDGMTPYVDSVTERMRKGKIMDIRLTPTTTRSDIFGKIAEQDNQDRPALFVRNISEQRVPLALSTGTDRDTKSKLDYHGGQNEKQAMREYAVQDVTDFTYVTDINPQDTTMIISKGRALLVYAVEAIQPLALFNGDRYGSIGMAAFVDKRLKERALLAVVRSAADYTSNIGGVAVMGSATLNAE